MIIHCNYDQTMTQEWICTNEDETAKIAHEIASSIRFPSIILLNGDLGAGKTAFSRAFIRHLMNDLDLTVPSPTYTLVQVYDDETIWHFDLYRMNAPDEIYDLGWEEALQAKLCLIEWPDRLGSLKPKNAINITIDVLQDDVRRITLTP